MDRVPAHTPNVSLLSQRGHIAGRSFKYITSNIKTFSLRLSIMIAALILYSVTVPLRIRESKQQVTDLEIGMSQLWGNVPSLGWHPSSDPRYDWEPPLKVSNGYLLVRCNGGLIQTSSAVSSAVVAARIMNATLVLPHLDTNSYWHDDSGFSGIFDVQHFIETLKGDVEVVLSMPKMVVRPEGESKKLIPLQMNPPRVAPPSWYATVATDALKKHGALILSPYSHRLAEELDNAELQRLRCRANFHALRFNQQITTLGDTIIRRLRTEVDMQIFGFSSKWWPAVALHEYILRGCFDIFTPEEQAILRKYRRKHYTNKELVYSKRRRTGNCPLTPEEVGLFLRAMGLDSSTRLYIAVGDFFGGDRFMQPLRDLFPRLVNHSAIVTPEELKIINDERRGLWGSAIDYLVCLNADVFMPTYDGPSNFANNLMGHRLYNGFRTTIQPDRRALAPIFMDREAGITENFETRIRTAMLKMPLGSPHPRIPPQSFYANPWPECFCKPSPDSPEDQCPHRT